MKLRRAIYVESFAYDMLQFLITTERHQNMALRSSQTIPLIMFPRSGPSQLEIYITIAVFL